MEDGGVGVGWIIGGMWVVWCGWVNNVVLKEPNQPKKKRCVCVFVHHSFCKKSSKSNSGSAFAGLAGACCGVDGCWLVDDVDSEEVVVVVVVDDVFFPPPPLPPPNK